MRGNDRAGITGAQSSQGGKSFLRRGWLSLSKPSLSKPSLSKPSLSKPSLSKLSLSKLSLSKLSLILLPVTLLGGCSGQSLQNALAPDPRLVGTPAPTATSSAVEPRSQATPIPGTLLSPTNPLDPPSPGAMPTSAPGPLSPSPTTTSAPVAPRLEPGPPQQLSDLDQAPGELRPAIADLAALGVLLPDPRTGTGSTGTGSTGTGSASAGSTASSTATGFSGNPFNPNQPVTRRDFARWLLVGHNLFNRDRPSRQIRLASPTSRAVFSDVSSLDPDFAAIQGLAEAGMVPSSLSGDTIVSFRPDEPLQREEMVLWKAPLDSAQTLPKPNLDAVREAWGFQDAGKIDPRALGAVLADFQSGDQAMIRRTFGYTTLFQPQKSVTRAEAAAALAYFGSQNQGTSAADLRRKQGGAAPTP
jgi:hypothetical protein